MNIRKIRPFLLLFLHIHLLVICIFKEGSTNKMRQCKVIAVENQKGGTGKSTTVLNLGVGLVRHGKMVMLIDADPQGSLSISLGIARPEDLDITLATVIEANNFTCPKGQTSLSFTGVRWTAEAPERSAETRRTSSDEWSEGSRLCFKANGLQVNKVFVSFRCVSRSSRLFNIPSPNLRL